MSGLRTKKACAPVETRPDNTPVKAQAGLQTQAVAGAEPGELHGRVLQERLAHVYALVGRYRDLPFGGKANRASDAWRYMRVTAEYPW
jgi:hypothetical protein